MQGGEQKEFRNLRRILSTNSDLEKLKHAQSEVQLPFSCGNLSSQLSQIEETPHESLQKQTDERLIHDGALGITSPANAEYAGDHDI